VRRMGPDSHVVRGPHSRGGRLPVGGAKRDHRFSWSSNKRVVEFELMRFRHFRDNVSFTVPAPHLGATESPSAQERTLDQTTGATDSETVERRAR
jgi:hypothetical protein